MEAYEFLSYESRIGTKIDTELFKNLSNEGFSLIRLRPNGKQADRENGWQQYCSIYRKYSDINRDINDNMGIAIGPASGVICLDIDDVVLFVDWCYQNKISIEDTRIHKTVKGFHLFYKRWKNIPRINRLSLRNIGIDIMLDKSQVVAPGSIVATVSGCWQYFVLNKNKVIDPPNWVLQLIAPNRDGVFFLDKKWRELIQKPPVEGERNNLLFKVLCTARNKGAEKKYILEFAQKYSSLVGLPEREALSTAESVVSKNINLVNKINDIHINSPLNIDIVEMIEGITNEIKISAEIANYWFDKYKYCVSNNNWYINNNNVWEELGNGRAPNALDPVLDYLSNYINDENCKKDVLKLYKKYQTFLSHKNLIGFLKNNSLLSISENEFDNNIMTLPMRNAVIEFYDDNIVVRPIKWDDFIRKTIPIEWPYHFGYFKKHDLEILLDEDSFKFDKILSNIFRVNIECKDLLIKLLGYSLTGTSKKIKLLPILIGSGNNGKSVLFRMLQSSFSPLAITVTKGLLLNKADSDDRPKPEMLALQGIRLGLIGESDDNDYLNESTVKALTGGDIRSARNLYSKDMVQIKPTYTLFLATNHEPKVLGGGKALWDRLLPIPFKMNFVNEIKNEEEEILIDETIWDWSNSPHLGILVYLLIGWLDYATYGLGKIPVVISNYKKEYKDDEDQYSEFRDECLRKKEDKNAYITFRELCRAYRNWCNDNQITINSRLSDRSIKRGILNSLREWNVQESYLSIKCKTIRGINNIMFTIEAKEEYMTARPIKRLP